MSYGNIVRKLCLWNEPLTCQVLCPFKPNSLEASIYLKPSHLPIYLTDQQQTPGLQVRVTEYM